MPAITFQVDDHGVPPGVFLFVGRELYGLACPTKSPGTLGAPYGLICWAQDDSAVIDFDSLIPKAINSKLILNTRLDDVTLTGETAEQHIAFELARYVLSREMERIIRRARYDNAGRYMNGIQEMIEGLEQQMIQIDYHARNGFTREQFDLLTSAHHCLEGAHSDLDRVVDPESD